ncbi:MAG: biopolymer transporter ExbD, partial [Victivallales bacterium]|nr:biopolymer transporter ExbD [Victivallales bacterium]
AMAKGLNAGEAKAEMTPMIDVVFQLLIFFVVTLHQEDILSRLMASRPAPDKNAKPEEQPDLINIEIFRGGFIVKGRVVSLEELDRQMRNYAAMSKTANVLLRCTRDSPHQYLVQALDICAKHQMTNLSIFSM